MLIYEFSRPDKTQKEEIIQDFIEFVKDKLHIDAPVNIEFSYDTETAQDEHHTGSYNVQTQKMWIYMKNRNLVDILRSICHEFVHVKQGQDGKLNREVPPEDKLESQAHSIAGYLIKLYGAKNHNIYE